MPPPANATTTTHYLFLRAFEQNIKKALMADGGTVHDARKMNGNMTKTHTRRRV